MLAAFSDCTPTIRQMRTGSIVYAMPLIAAAANRYDDCIQSKNFLMISIPMVPAGTYIFIIKWSPMLARQFPADSSAYA